MRSKGERVERLVCAEHCRHFKPWEGEERRCGAHQWLVQRTLNVEGTLADLEKLRGAKPSMPLRFDALLLRTVCTGCEYYPNQCKYRRPTGPTDTVPCGGVVVLSLLLDRELISAEELYDPPWLRDAEGS
jgi:hypothetical protein